jgi:hypothetical protein
LTVTVPLLELKSEREAVATPLVNVRVDGRTGATAAGSGLAAMAVPVQSKFSVSRALSRSMTALPAMSRAVTVAVTLSLPATTEPMLERLRL